MGTKCWYRRQTGWAGGLSRAQHGLENTTVLVCVVRVFVFVPQVSVLVYVCLLVYVCMCMCVHTSCIKLGELHPL